MLEQFKELAIKHGVQSAEIIDDKLIIKPFANRSYNSVYELFSEYDSTEPPEYNEDLEYILCTAYDRFNTQIYEAVFEEVEE